MTRTLAPYTPPELTEYTPLEADRRIARRDVTLLLRWYSERPHRERHAGAVNPNLGRFLAICCAISLLAFGWGWLTGDWATPAFTAGFSLAIATAVYLMDAAGWE